MAVYVDGEFNSFGRMKMCHLVADTEAELHAMADKLGLKRKWYQGSASTPHYDVAKGKRELAVFLGVVEIDRRQMYAIIKKIRTERHLWSRV